VAKPPEKVLQEAIERDMPGYTLSKKALERDARRTTQKPDAVSPDIETLRKRYVKRSTSRSAPQTNSVDAGTPEAEENKTETGYEDAIVPVEPVDRTRDGRLPGGSRSKRVVYSGSDDKIIGRQG